MKKDERRSRLGALSLVLFFSIFSSACSNCGETKAGADAAATATTTAAPPVAVPGQRPPTTSPEIALNNFNGDIDQRLGRLGHGRVSDRITVVGMLIDRAHYLGKIADLELAERIAKGEENVTDAGAKEATRDAGAPAPSDAGARDAGARDAGPSNAVVVPEGEAILARALVDAAFHRFDRAMEGYDAAEKAGVQELRIRPSRASVFMARGEYDKALALQLPMIEKREATQIATAAVLANKMQKNADSERLFGIARDRFGDVSPFALSWIDFQHGTVLELDGEDARARTWFDEAVDILPQYAHAVVHLAPTMTPPLAIEMLERVQKTSDDPEVLAALAAAHKRAGHTAEPGPLVEQAKKRYDEIVAKYPEAFADHAARFWLNAGNDPKKALELAKVNAKNRPTEDALDLWMAAAAGAKNNDDVCTAAKQMLAFKYLSPRGKKVASAAAGKCP